MINRLYYEQVHASLFFLGCPDLSVKEGQGHLGRTPFFLSLKKLYDLRRKKIVPTEKPKGMLTKRFSFVVRPFAKRTFSTK
jgi:hypothetical protein